MPICFDIGINLSAQQQASRRPPVKDLTTYNGFKNNMVQERLDQLQQKWQDGHPQILLFL